MELDELKDCSYKPSKMTREQKELLLKDLCVRLPYGVKLLHTPTALDVYQGNTTLEITYRDSIPVDSVVVWKEEFKK